MTPAERDRHAADRLHQALATYSLHSVRVRSEDQNRPTGRLVVVLDVDDAHQLAATLAAQRAQT